MALRNRKPARHHSLSSVRATERREWLRIAGVPASLVRRVPKRTLGHMIEDLDN